MATRFDSTRTKTGKARRLRREATPAERLLWSKLSGNQLDYLKFRRQHPIGPYVLDFYCPELKLCIELDGEQHAFDENAAKDAARTDYLERRGIRVLRFWNSEVLQSPAEVANRIYQEAELLDRDRSSRPGEVPSPCKGEG